MHQFLHKEVTAVTSWCYHEEINIGTAMHIDGEVLTNRIQHQQVTEQSLQNSAIVLSY